MDIFELLAKGETAQAEADQQAIEEEEFLKSSKPKKLSPFDALSSIYMKDYIMSEDVESQYRGLMFMINRGMSQEPETIGHAYIMSTSGANLPPSMHYDYYFHAIRKGKRYTKWAKADKYEFVDLIVEVYQVSKPKAIGILGRLSEDDLARLQEWWNSRTGGLKRTK